MQFFLRRAITISLLGEILHLAFPTFSADPKRRDDRHHAFPISPHSALNLKKRKIFAFLPFFPTFSVDPKRREILHLAFPISLHLVLTLNVGMIVTMFFLFPYIQR